MQWVGFQPAAAAGVVGTELSQAICPVLATVPPAQSRNLFNMASLVGVSSCPALPTVCSLLPYQHLPDKLLESSPPKLLPGTPKQHGQGSYNVFNSELQPRRCYLITLPRCLDFLFFMSRKGENGSKSELSKILTIHRVLTWCQNWAKQVCTILWLECIPKKHVGNLIPM